MFSGKCGQFPGGRNPTHDIWHTSHRALQVQLGDLVVKQMCFRTFPVPTHRKQQQQCLNWKGSRVTINIHQRPLDPLQQWRCLTTASIHKSSPCPARGNSPRQTGVKVCTECFLRLSFGFCHTHSNSANSRVRCWCEWSTSGRDPAPGVRFPSVWRRLALVWKDYTRFPSVKQHEWLRAVLWLWTVQRSLRTERGLFFSVKTGGGFWPSFKKALCFSLTKKMLAHEHSQPRERFKWPKEEVQYHSASFFLQLWLLKCRSTCLQSYCCLHRRQHLCANVIQQSQSSDPGSLSSIKTKLHQPFFMHQLQQGALPWARQCISLSSSLLMCLQESANPVSGTYRDNCWVRFSGHWQ